MFTESKYASLYLNHVFGTSTLFFRVLHHDFYEFGRIDVGLRGRLWSTFVRNPRGTSIGRRLRGVLAWLVHLRTTASLIDTVSRLLRAVKDTVLGAVSLSVHLVLQEVVSSVFELAIKR